MCTAAVSKLVLQTSHAIHVPALNAQLMKVLIALWQ